MRIHNPRWLQHDRSRKPELGERKSVTVCVATIFRWNFGSAEQIDYGWAAVVASDRMRTSGDVQYEPFQLKLGTFTPSCLVMVSGDFGMHSEAFRETYKQTKPDSLPSNIARIYAQQLQAIKRREAEDLYLAPLGLNTDTFLAQQKDMSEKVVNTLLDQLQTYRGEDVEALIVGQETVRDHNSVRLFAINSHGVIACCDDIGFAAIGAGAWHARSVLMQAKYINTSTFAPALALTYAAKKAAEIAPGVGKDTDMHIILKNKIETVTDDTMKKLDSVHGAFSRRRESLAADAIRDIQEYLTGKPQLDLRDQHERKEIPGGNAQTDARANAAAPEAARKDEGGEGKTVNYS
jgi:hypothetical protein